MQTTARFNDSTPAATPWSSNTEKDWWLPASATTRVTRITWHERPRQMTLVGSHTWPQQQHSAEGDNATNNATGQHHDGCKSHKCSNNSTHHCGLMAQGPRNNTTTYTRSMLANDDNGRWPWSEFGQQFGRGLFWSSQNGIYKTIEWILLYLVVSVEVNRTRSVSPVFVEYRPTTRWFQLQQHCSVSWKSYG